MPALEVFVDHSLPEAGDASRVLSDEYALDQRVDDADGTAAAHRDSGEFGVRVELDYAATRAGAAHRRVGVAHPAGHRVLEERRGYAGDLHFDLSILALNVRQNRQMGNRTQRGHVKR